MIDLKKVFNKAIEELSNDILPECVIMRQNNYIYFKIDNTKRKRIV